MLVSDLCSNGFLDKTLTLTIGDVGYTDASWDIFELVMYSAAPIPPETNVIQAVFASV